MYDGYFVHYFAPRRLPVIPKDVIFVIDISGSMIGTKLKQVMWTRVKLNYFSAKDKSGSVTSLISVSRLKRPWTPSWETWEKETTLISSPSQIKCTLGRKDEQCEPPGRIYEKPKILWEGLLQKDVSFYDLVSDQSFILCFSAKKKYSYLNFSTIYHIANTIFSTLWNSMW